MKVVLSLSTSRVTPHTHARVRLRAPRARRPRPRARVPWRVRVIRVRVLDRRRAGRRSPLAAASCSRCLCLPRSALRVFFEISDSRHITRLKNTLLPKILNRIGTHGPSTPLTGSRSFRRLSSVNPWPFCASRMAARVAATHLASRCQLARRRSHPGRAPRSASARARACARAAQPPRPRLDPERSTARSAGAGCGGGGRSAASARLPSRSGRRSRPPAPRRASCHCARPRPAPGSG